MHCEIGLERMVAMTGKTQSSTPSRCCIKTSATTPKSKGISRSSSTQVQYGPVLVCILYALCVVQTFGQSGLPGSWEIVVPDAGVASMHTSVTRYGNVVLLDRTNIGATTLPLPGEQLTDMPCQQLWSVHRSLWNGLGGIVFLSYNTRWIPGFRNVKLYIKTRDFLCKVSIPEFIDFGSIPKLKNE